MSYYTLIPRTNLQPTLKPLLLIKPTIKQVWEALESVEDGTPVGYDIETTGLHPKNDSIVCIGLATSKGSMCIDTRDPTIESRVIHWIAKRSHFAFNSVFDELFLEHRNAGAMDNLLGDTMVLFKMLASEGFFGQRWNVESLISNVLGWPINNKTTIAELLKEQGLSKANMSKLMDTHIEEFMTYCAHDAEAAYQGMVYLRKVARDKGWETNIIEIHDVLFKNLIELTIEQKLAGVKVNTQGAIEYEEELTQAIDTAKEVFFNQEEVRAYVDRHNKPILEEWNKPLVSSRKVWAKRSDEPWNNRHLWIQGEKASPAKWEVEFGCWFKNVVSIKPRVRKTQPKTFSITSKKDLKKLYYGVEGVGGLAEYAVTRQPDPDNEKPWLRHGEFKIHTPCGHEAPLKMTPSGGFPVDKKALTFFGESGRLLKEHNAIVSTRQFVRSLLKVTEDNGYWHPDLKVFGTVTSRGSGGTEDNAPKDGKLSPQILPKDEKFLKLLGCDKDESLIHLDFASLEPTITAEVSKDPLMMEVYGSDKPHDIYLFMAIKNDRRGAEINKVYNIDNPTGESVATTKKSFKPIRVQWKEQVLKDAYGGGAESVRRGLMQEGVWLSVAESRENHKNFQHSLEGRNQWKKQLEREWEANGGFIYNPLDIPVCCPSNMLKDLASRSIQSGGHYILLVFLLYINRLRKERKVAMRPWNPDLHDATIWTVKTGHEQAAKKVFEDALSLTNKLIDGTIPIAGDVDIGKTFADFKD